MSIDEFTENTTKTGRSLGGAYRGHFLDLFEFEGKVQWSATHPTYCVDRKGKPMSGAAGIETNHAVATTEAKKAVDRFPCIRADERKARER